MTLGRRRLGHSGIEVSTLALGTMMFGAWGNTDESECHRMVDLALDAGITLIDTADIYDAGVSEHIVGDAIRGRRDKVVLATKVGNPMSDDPTHRGLSRRWIVQACEASLRRLDVDHIDLYQMHRPDPATPVDETLAAFDDLVRSGKVRAIGTSTFTAAELDDLHRCADMRGFTRPTSEQPPYSVLARGADASVLPWCAERDVGAIVWAPLNGGWLTGKYQDGAGELDSRARRTPEHFDHADDAVRARKVLLVDRLQAIASDAGMSLVQLGLAFVLAHPAVTSAIVGPRRPDQLKQLLAAGHLDLPADVLAAIDGVVAPGENVNPHDAGR